MPWRAMDISFSISRACTRDFALLGRDLLLGAWSSLVLLSGQYDELYTLVIFPSWISYGMTAAAVIVLRRKTAGS